MKILVTGGAGFIGSHCTDLLVDAGHDVLVLDDLSYGKEENLNEKSRFENINLCDYEMIKNLIETFEPSHIFHFAANATTKTSAMGWNNPFNDYKINMVGTLNLLEAIRSLNLDIHLIYASTAAVYGEPKVVPIKESHINEPLSPYGVSKLAGEKYCIAYFREFSVKMTILRIFNTYGPRQPRYVMYDQIKNILKKNTDNNLKVLGTGKQLRDYAYVTDTVKAFHNCMLYPEKSIGKIFNVAGGNKYSIAELIKMLKTALNKESLSEKYTGESWNGDIEKLWADTTNINKNLGWYPSVNISDGIKNLIDWIKINEKL
jgi:UDP-glucose 4-epimerase